MHKNIFLYFIISILICGCSDNNDNHNEEETESGIYTVTYRINAQNRVDLNATDEEMMSSILLYIVNSSNIVEAIIDMELPSLVEDYLAEVQLTAGVKDIYGFANLSNAIRTQAGLAGITEGSTMPDISQAVVSITNGYEINGSTGSYLPMSNHIKFRVSNLSGQLFSMELIRLVCKVRFTFRNESGDDITLQQLTMTPITNSPVFLLPQEGGTSVFPAGHTQDDYGYNLDGYILADGDEVEYTTYINESEVTEEGWFQVWVLTQSGQQTSTVQRMALTNLSSLVRNDYLDLPLILTDYRLELDVRSYPPIGGYPASVVEDGDEYHITFSGGGPFVIVPSLIRLSDDTIVEVADADWTFTYSDTATGFFDEAPVFENGEIHGVIRASASGSVLFTLSAEITTSAGVTRTLSYRIYITQN